MIKPESQCFGCHARIGIPVYRSAKLLGLHFGTVRYWHEKAFLPGAVKLRRKITRESMRRQRKGGRRERDRLWQAEWRKKNAELARGRGREYDRKRRQKESFRERRREYAAAKRKSSPSFDIGVRLRVRIANALSRRGRPNKSGSLFELLGCSWVQFLAHIENQFTPGMTWENRAEWHVDHIKPCCAFDLTKPEEQRACFHYTNLRPLWAHENLSKNGKY